MSTLAAESIDASQLIDPPTYDITQYADGCDIPYVDSTTFDYPATPIVKSTSEVLAGSSANIQSPFDYCSLQT
jgi:hypothetical protein